MKREKKLALRKRVIRDLDTNALAEAQGGIFTMTFTLFCPTVTETITIILSSPCSNVYSKCSQCPTQSEINCTVSIGAGAVGCAG